MKFSTPWEMDYWMESNGFYCGFNMPNLKSEFESNKLPEYAWRKSFLTDNFLSCPENWMKSSGITSSYFVAVQKDKGMWLDFNKNNDNQHDVAIVVSIQGINPITGMACTDCQMEQYIQKCPKCKIAFEANRYCPSCKYKWPKQNYISTTGQPFGYLWIDGFRTINGIVRQYAFTDDVLKGVAANIIGQDRVFAIGISFFISQEPKRKTINNYLSSFETHKNNIQKWEYNLSSTTASSYTDGSPFRSFATNSTSTISDCRKISEVCESQSTFEIGAGKEIKQDIFDDPHDLSYWKDKPSSIIVINYASENEISKIISGGRKNKQQKTNGFLDGMSL